MEVLICNKLMCNTYASTYYVLLPGFQHIFAIEGITLSSYHLNGPLLQFVQKKAIMTAVSQVRERRETKKCPPLTSTMTIQLIFIASRY